MNMQIALMISPVRMFFFARRRVIMGGKSYLLRPFEPRSETSPRGRQSYRCASATMAMNSSAR
jgi:hypothetical protein